MGFALLPPEAQLLFLSGGGPDNDAAIRQLLAHDLDWAEVCRLAEREKAAPVLWRRINDVAPDRVPPAAAAFLGRLAHVVSFRMAYMEDMVVASAAALDEAGIEYTLLKGAALACDVYGSFTNRPMVDLDLLVSAPDADRTVAALLSAGWRWRADKIRGERTDQMYHLPALVDANAQVSVEVHVALFPGGHPFGITPGQLLASVRELMFHGQRIRVPAVPHLLLHSCIHFAWSSMMRQGAWRSFRDVGTTIAAHPVDWQAFVAAATDVRARTCCFWTFRLARTLMGIDIPDDVLAALRPRLPATTLRALERHFALILLPSGSLCPSVSLRRVMWSAGMLPRASGHGAVRPWTLLSLRPEDVAERAARPDAIRAAEARRSLWVWRTYWRGVLRGAA